MLLNKLTLKNFGVYENRVEIDLRPTEPDKPLVLIYGKNGSGKTTILEAIRIALYGSLLFGTKTITDTYLKHIELRLNKNATTKADSKHFVSLSFNMTERGVTTEYTITREWVATKDRIRENASVFRNGYQLDKKSALDFEDYVKRFIPISVFDMLFLDGEHLNSLFEGNKFQGELGKALMPLCGLDVYELLHRDLDSFLRTKNSYTTLDQDQKHYQEIEAEYYRMLHDKQSLLTKIERLQKEIVATKLALSTYESDLKNYGIKEIPQLQHEMSKLELHRKELNEVIKAFVADLLPFVIAKPIVKQVIEQIEKEDRHLKSRQAKDFIRTPEVRQLIESSVHPGGPQDLDMIDSILDAISQALSIEEDTSLIHNLSPEQTAIFFHIWEHICEDNFDLPFQEIATTSNALAALRKQKSLLADTEIVYLMNKLKTTSALLGEQESDLQKLHEQLSEVEQSLVSTQMELEKTAELVFRSKRDENIFLITHKLKKVLDEFVSTVLSFRTEKLGERITEHLLNILQKQHFINTVRVDSASLELRMFDHNNRSISPLSLSAGEKQLLVLSALWALLEVSDRQLPLVFDTLIGRLDSTHKVKVLSEVLPRISQQVILLATDTEVNMSGYLALKPFLGRMLYLDYIDDIGKTVPREMNTHEFPFTHVSTNH